MGTPLEDQRLDLVLEAALQSQPAAAAHAAADARMAAVKDGRQLVFGYHLIEVRSDGLRHGPAEVMARLARGEPAPPAGCI